MEDIRYAYFREENGKPRLTIARKYLKDSNTIEYNFALCSKRDNFKKSVGRMVASGRLNKSPQIFKANFGSKQVSGFEILKLIAEDIVEKYPNSSAAKFSKKFIKACNEYYNW